MHFSILKLQKSKPYWHTGPGPRKSLHACWTLKMEQAVLLNIHVRVLPDGSGVFGTVQNQGLGWKLTAKYLAYLLTNYVL